MTMLDYVAIYLLYILLYYFNISPFCWNDALYNIMQIVRNSLRLWSLEKGVVYFIQVDVIVLIRNTEGLTLIYLVVFRDFFGVL